MQAIRQLAIFLVFFTALSANATAQNCNNPIQLNCGSNYNGSNNTGNYNHTSYPFAQYPDGMTGPEAYHRLTIVFPALVTITMSSQTPNQDLDLFLLSACNNTSGLAYSQNATGSEQISINLSPGTYYLIVDGWNGAISNYNLTIQCNQTTACNAPAYADIYASDISCSSARFYCQTSGPNTWVWAYRQLNTANWIELPATFAYFYDLGGLQASTTYEYKCKIRCSNYYWSGWSPIRQFSTPNCGSSGNSCNNPITAYCGYTYTGNNGSGSYNFNTYKFNGQLITGENGPEKIYQITLAAAGPISISLGGLSGDLDLFLLNNCNNNAVVAVSGNSGSLGEVISVGNLAAGTYQIVIDGWNSTLSNYSLSIACNVINPISNDEPCNPTIISPYTYCYPTNTTNVGATITNNPLPPECSPQNMRDVWFKVGIPASGKILVSTFPGTLTDGLLGIYAGAYCTGLTNYGCFDDYPTSNDLMPDVIIQGTPGSYVYLRLWGYSGAMGTFSICVTTLYNFNDRDADVTIGDDTTGGGDRSEETNTASGKEKEAKLEPTTPSIRLFPVPAQEEINLTTTFVAESSFTVRIVNMTGQIVQEETLSNAPAGEFNTTIDISRLPSGTYLLRFQSDGQETTSKFVKI